MKLSGLGYWNLYFLIKFVMYYFGLIQFDALSNSALAALLFLQFNNKHLEQLKHVLGAVFAITLLYKDSWLPPLSRLTKQADNVQSFSFEYFIELTARLLNIDMLLGLFIIIVCFWYTSQWLRYTTVTVIGLAFIGYQATNLTESPPLVTSTKSITTDPLVIQNTRTPDEQLEDFYQQQSRLATEFPKQYQGDEFDVVILNICSLAVADLQAIGVSLNDLYSDFDVVFSDFNSATSYSGPAAVRVLRASCGQAKHESLFNEAPEQCYLFKNLEKLGYSSQVLMNHDGKFDNFNQLVNRQANFKQPSSNKEGIPIAQYGFDNKSIYSDGEVLSRWFNKQSEDCAPCALYYNSISLHDGNQLANSPRMSSIESYPTRLSNLFTDITQFIEQLETRNRNVMLMIVPEHGAALKGDKVQFAGLREIPSPSIISVPAAIKFIGANVPQFKQVTVSRSTSYFALSELVSKVMKTNFFAGNNVMSELVSGLPVAPKVAENEGAILMYVNKRPYIQVDQGGWSMYPQN